MAGAVKALNAVEQRLCLKERDFHLTSTKICFRTDSTTSTILKRVRNACLLVQAKKYQGRAKLPRKGAVLAKGKTLSQYRNTQLGTRGLAFFATGMHVGEVSALNMADFAVSESIFRIQGKGGRDRLAFLVDDQTRRIQQDHLELRFRIASTSQALFLNA